MSSPKWRRRVAAIFVVAAAGSVVAAGSAEAVTKSGSKTCASNTVFTTSVQLAGTFSGIVQHSPGGAQEDFVNGYSATVVSKFMYASHNGGTHTWTWNATTMGTPSSVCEL